MFQSRLPSHLTARLSRFQREAEVLAALNHPHIAGIYGLEEKDGQRALVMELVDGDDLSQLVTTPGSQTAALSVPDALAMAKQIAEALEAAHEIGIIHRDLKPSNIKVRPDGTVKVLDFGLAKLTEPVVNARATGGLSQSPTITTPAMTAMGIILGTAAYMSPEQARGRVVEKRTDIWAFGAVLFEMLTGRRAFEGEDTSLTLAAVMKSDPDYAALPRDLPPVIRTCLVRCLHKDPRQRVRDIGDVRLMLDGAFDTPAHRVLVAALGDLRIYDLETGRETRVTSDRSVAGYNEWMPGDGAVAYSSTRKGGRGLMNIWIQPLDGSRRATSLTQLEGQVHVDSWSPDGQTLAAHQHPAQGAGNVQLLVIPVKDGAGNPTPFRGSAAADESDGVFSPDGRFLAYIDGVSGKGELVIRPFPGPGPAAHADYRGAELGGRAQASHPPKWNRVHSTQPNGTWSARSSLGNAPIAWLRRTPPPSGRRGSGRAPRGQVADPRAPVTRVMPRTAGRW